MILLGCVVALANLAPGRVLEIGRSLKLGEPSSTWTTGANYFSDRAYSLAVKAVRRRLSERRGWVAVSYPEGEAESAMTFFSHGSEEVRVLDMVGPFGRKDDPGVQMTIKIYPYIVASPTRGHRTRN